MVFSLMANQKKKLQNSFSESKSNLDVLSEQCDRNKGHMHNMDSQESLMDDS